LTGERRYTETEAAEALRINVASLRRMRRRCQEDDPHAWPCYTLEGLEGYYYTAEHLAQIASGAYRKTRQRLRAA
jgi:hypothetical protein